MRIPFFGTDPRQQRIDADAVTIADLTTKLAEEKARSREKGRLAAELLSERDAARIERDTAQRERDEYRADALKHRSSRAHLKQFQPKPNGAGQHATS